MKFLHLRAKTEKNGSEIESVLQILMLIPATCMEQWNTEVSSNLKTSKKWNGICSIST